jgi:hypothetical protein
MSKPGKHPVDMPSCTAPPSSSALVTERLSAEAALMRAAQSFACAFGNRTWESSAKHIEYTVFAWKGLALAAIAYAETIENQKA